MKLLSVQATVSAKGVGGEGSKEKLPVSFFPSTSSKISRAHRRTDATLLEKNLDVQFGADP